MKEFGELGRKSLSNPYFLLKKQMLLFQAGFLFQHALTASGLLGSFRK